MYCIGVIILAVRVITFEGGLAFDSLDWLGGDALFCWLYMAAGGRWLS